MTVRKLTSNTRGHYRQALLCCALFVSGASVAQDYDTLIQDALRLRASGDLSGAETLLLQAWELPSDQSEVAALLGMTMAFQGRLDQAMQLVDAALHLRPANLGLLNAKASIAWFQGDLALAESTNQRALQQRPGSVEALILSGRIALARGNPTLAQTQYLQALTLEPESVEANVGMYDALTSLGSPDLALNYLDEAARIQPDYEEVVARRLALRSTGTDLPGNQVSAGYSSSSVDQPGFSTWHDRFVDIRHQFQNGYGLNFHYEHNHRFDLHNNLYELGLNTPATQRLPLEIAIGFSPEHDFLPEHYLRLGSSTVVARSERLGTAVLVGGYQYSSYNNGNTQRLSLGIDYYLPGIDAWLSPAIGMVRDQDGKATFAWNLGGNWQISGNTRLGLDYGEAPETENLLTVDSRNTTAYLRQQLTSQVIALLYYSRTARTNAYTRDSWSLSLQYLF